MISTRFITDAYAVRTLDASKAHLQFFITTRDVARVALLDNVSLEVRRLQLDANVRTVTLSHRNGRIWVDASVSSGVRQHFTVETPSATIAVRGTRFYDEVAADGTTRAGCADGHVEVSAQGRSVMLDPGFFTTVRPGQPPDPPRWDVQEFGPRRRSYPAFNVEWIFIPYRGGMRPGGRPTPHPGHTSAPPPRPAPSSSPSRGDY